MVIRKKQIFNDRTLFNYHSDKEAIMPVWKCNHCGNTTEANTPPETCPACKEKCEFLDVSCYIPECGGPGSGNINAQVFQETSKKN